MSLTTFKARLAQATAILASNGENDSKPVTNEFREIVNASYNWLTRATRNEEINPLSYQYVPSQALTSASNAAAGTVSYFPSSAGVLTGPGKDISFHMYMSSSSGSIFTYIEATSDTNALPRWGDITPAGYSWSTNTGSYSTFSVATGSTDWFVSIENFNFEKIRVRTVIDYSGINSMAIYMRSKAL